MVVPRPAASWLGAQFEGAGWGRLTRRGRLAGGSERASLLSAGLRGVESAGTPGAGRGRGLGSSRLLSSPRACVVLPGGRLAPVSLGPCLGAGWDSAGSSDESCFPAVSL